MFGENSSAEADVVTLRTGDTILCRTDVASMALWEGDYVISVAAHSPAGDDIYDWHDSACRLRVLAIDAYSRRGQVGLRTSWSIGVGALR